MVDPQATSPMGVTDSVVAALNDEPIPSDAEAAPHDFDQRHLPGCKGPDPEHWSDPEERDELEYDPGDPSQTRHDGGIYYQEFAEDGSWTLEVDGGSKVTHVKGPGPEWTGT